MVALSDGLFARDGLNVQIVPGTPDDGPLRSVSAGSQAIGVVGAEQFLEGRARGLPIIAFAAAYLETPVVFYARAASAITAPRDFVGKRVGYRPGSDTQIIYQALLDRQSISRAGVKEVRVDADPGPFTADDVDVWPGHVGTDAYALMQRNIDYSTIAPADYGIHVPGTVYFATQDLARDNPDLIRRFLHAVVAGWQTTYADEGQAVAQIAAYDPTTLTPAFVRFKLDRQRQLLRPFGARFGEFADTHWRDLQQILLRQRLIAAPVDLSQAVTSDFLADVYRGADMQLQ